MINNGEWRAYENQYESWFADDWRGAFRYVAFMHVWSTSSWVTRMINRELERIMTRGGKGRKEASAGGNSGWTTFVDIGLSGAGWDDVLREFGDLDALADGISTLCASGYRVGISFNAQTDAFIVSVTCKLDGSPNNGKTFTSFAETWLGALQLACFKHYIVCAEVWPAPAGSKDGPRFG